MLLRDLVARAGLHTGAVPIEVVDLKLDELEFRVLGQHAVEQRRAVVEGKADVLYKPLRLFLPDPRKAVKRVVHVEAVHVDVVQQVIVEKFHAGLFALLVEDPVAVLLRLDEAGMQLRRQRKAVARVALHERLLGGALTLERAVHPRRVKIREAALEKGIHHLFGLLHVDLPRVVLVQRRQTHQAEAEFFLCHRLYPLLVFHPSATILARRGGKSK